MTHLHLTVLQARNAHQAAALGSSQRNEFVWNDDFTAFRIVPLKWWDDASYAEYQARDIDDRQEEGAPVPPAPLAPKPAPAPVLPQSEDDILF